MRLLNVDCRVGMNMMDENSVDTIITDPPYGLEFMGKEWDHGVPGVQFWEKALRVAKPGAMLLAFGGTRTYHRLTCAIEDAGWEIRDCIFWAYGQGFPKGQNIGKAIDRRAGANREKGNLKFKGGTQLGIMDDDAWVPKDVYESFPVTPLAQQWEGWNTTLKPAVEPIVMAMKPLDGTFAQNAEKWGVAGLWIDGGRIPTGDDLNGGAYAARGTERYDGYENWRFKREGDAGEFVQPQGRHPANLIHDGSPEVLACFPDSKGQQGDVRGTEPSRTGDENTNCYGEYGRVPSPKRNDSGSAARFFYCAKSAKSERNLGCDHLYWRKDGKLFTLISQSEYDSLPKPARRQGNIHPTVKPIALIRYLCRLTRTPTGGAVLDPFMGSGSTGVAAIEEGRDFIGFDSDRMSYIIAEARTDYALQRKSNV